MSFEIVYVFRAGHTNLFKVGTTTNLQRRIDVLQTGCPYPLSVWRAFTCRKSEGLERYCHGVLEPFRLHGEWFELAPTELEAKLDEVCNRRAEKDGGPLLIYDPHKPPDLQAWFEAQDDKGEAFGAVLTVSGFDPLYVDAARELWRDAFFEQEAGE